MVPMAHSGKNGAINQNFFMITTAPGLNFETAFYLYFAICNGNKITQSFILNR